MRYMLVSLLAGICLAATCDSRACDYTVTRSTAIESQRPIWLLVVDAGMGVIHGSSFGSDSSLHAAIRTAGDVRTTLTIDERPAPGIGGVASAAWRLVGFVVWNADGTIERRTRATVRGHSVTIDDHVENGRVWVRVVIGPPLGDRRVRCAVLELEATESECWATTADRIRVPSLRGRTRIQLSCAAQIDLPGDRCRLIRRVATRIAEREAGPELTGRVRTLELAGRAAVQQGEDAMPEIVARFIDIVTRRAVER